MLQLDNVSEALHERLAKTAERLRQASGLSDHDLAMAFAGVAVTLASHAHGPVACAEWLRDIADEEERRSLELH
jgi:hypothetical protein